MCSVVVISRVEIMERDEWNRKRQGKEIYEQALCDSRGKVNPEGLSH